VVRCGEVKSLANWEMGGEVLLYKRGMGGSGVEWMVLDGLGWRANRLIKANLDIFWLRYSPTLANHYSILLNTSTVTCFGLMSNTAYIIWKSSKLPLYQRCRNPDAS
jgi:hypothetical protein